MPTITFRENLEIRYFSALRQGFTHTASALREVLDDVPLDFEASRTGIVGFPQDIDKGKPNLDAKSLARGYSA